MTAPNPAGPEAESQIGLVKELVVNEAAVVFHSLRSGIAYIRAERAEGKKDELYHRADFYEDLRDDAIAVIEDTPTINKETGVRDTVRWDKHTAPGARHPNMPAAAPVRRALDKQEKSQKLMREMEEGKTIYHPDGSVEQLTPEQVRLRYFFPVEEPKVNLLRPTPEEDARRRFSVSRRTGTTPPRLRPHQLRSPAKTFAQRENEKLVHDDLKKLADGRDSQSSRMNMFGAAKETVFRETNDARKKAARINDRALRRGEVTPIEHAKRKSEIELIHVGKAPHAVHHGHKKLDHVEKRVTKTVEKAAKKSEKAADRVDKKAEENHERYIKRDRKYQQARERQRAILERRDFAREAAAARRAGP